MLRFCGSHPLNTPWTHPFTHRLVGHALLREWSLIFYGTTQSIGPNDPISVPKPSGSEATTPNSSSTTSNLHQAYSPQYPRIPPNNFGSSPSGGSKLPLGKVPPPNKSSYVTNNPLLNSAPPKQGYQQISATYGVILGKANGKSNNNSKEKTNNKGNKSNNGNKGKSGGSSGNRKEQTTQSTIIQTSTSKNKYYRISQQQQQKNNKQDRNGVQTQRPKANSGEKSYDEKSRKVVGEITTNSGNGSIKAAKQVKESTTTSSNSRIPKLFERYEKIQAIFPELEPYENSSPKGKPKQAKQGKQFEVDLFKPTNGGNSRQGNTKKSPSVPPPSQTMATLSILPILPAGGSSFLPDQKILKKQQLLMAAAGVMAPAQVEVEMEEVHATPDNEARKDQRKEVNGPNGSQPIFGTTYFAF